MCSACQMGKSHRLPNHNVHTRSSKAFEIVHVDVWGPSPTINVNGMNTLFYLFMIIQNINGFMLCTTKAKLSKYLLILKL